MKIAGYTVLSVGIVFGTIMAIGMASEGKFQIAPLILPVMVIAGGISLISGSRMRGPLRSAQPPVVTREGGSAQPTTQTEAATRELPAAPAIMEVISSHRRRGRRLILIITGSMMAFFLLFGTGIGYLAGARIVLVLPFAFAGSIALGLIIGGVWLLVYGRPTGRDLDELTYLRTTGPIQVVKWTGGAGTYYSLRLCDRSFLLKDKHAATALGGLSWAIVDHTRNAHLVLAAWDQAGNAVYRLGNKS